MVTYIQALADYGGRHYDHPRSAPTFPGRLG